MNNPFLKTDIKDDRLTLVFSGEFTLYQINQFQLLINDINFSKFNTIIIDLKNLDFIDTASAIFINDLYKQILKRDKKIHIDVHPGDISNTLKFIQNTMKSDSIPHSAKKENILRLIGKKVYAYYLTLLSFLSFLGELFINLLYTLRKPKTLRYKEILFEINETALKAFFIVALSSFLVGIVIAYQSANQLSLYGANIFIVDMIGLSMLRELSPVITAVIIAGRSGSAFTRANRCYENYAGARCHAFNGL